MLKVLARAERQEREIKGIQFGKCYGSCVEAGGAILGGAGNFRMWGQVGGLSLGAIPCSWILPPISFCFLTSIM
jgi:hypothetical protein